MFAKNSGALSHITLKKCAVLSHIVFFILEASIPYIEELSACAVCDIRENLFPVLASFILAPIGELLSNARPQASGLLIAAFIILEAGVIAKSQTVLLRVASIDHLSL